jgi:hypothetical protein
LRLYLDSIFPISRVKQKRQRDADADKLSPGEIDGDYSRSRICIQIEVDDGEQITCQKREEQ